jgi:macrophage erythroblast attacher
MLRFQQYIELVRTEDEAKLIDAITHAKKYLIPSRSLFPREVSHACGLLAFPPNRLSASAPYAKLYEPSRWIELADLFTETHNNLLALPYVPLLHIALSSGLSALKTPACHSSHATLGDAASTSSGSSFRGVCPICSTELNKLARNVPYAHHTKSHVEHDLMLLPNGRVYGKKRLLEQAAKAGIAPHLVQDLITGHVYGMQTMKKVFIS